MIIPARVQGVLASWLCLWVVTIDQSPLKAALGVDRAITLDIALVLPARSRILKRQVLILLYEQLTKAGSVPELFSLLLGDSVKALGCGKSLNNQAPISSYWVHHNATPVSGYILNISTILEESSPKMIFLISREEFKILVTVGAYDAPVITLNRFKLQK